MGRPRYTSFVYDSARWDGFELRAGDIVICTPPKCGTTWTQMICALLVFQTRELPAPLFRLSPWIDMKTRSRHEMCADLAAQTHRRFLKTHTPLDGLPQDPTVTYLCVGRDPRDAGISMQHHLDNFDLAAVRLAMAAAAEADGIEVEPPAPPRPRPTDLAEQLWAWVADDRDPTTSGSTLRFTLHHLESFRQAPDHLDVVTLHYDDLLRDLGGQMRALADRLGIDVPAARWTDLVDAASLTSMRDRASTTVPGSAPDQWRDPAGFFRSGTSRQWESILDGDGVQAYARRARELAPDALIGWVHRPPLP